MVTRGVGQIGWVDGVLLLLASSWALVAAIWRLLALQGFLVLPQLSSWVWLPLDVALDMVCLSGEFVTVRSTPTVQAVLWQAGVGPIVIGAVLAACGWGLWQRKAWASYLLFVIAVLNTVILGVHLVRLGIPDMMEHHQVNLSYLSELLVLGYYGSVVVRFGIVKILNSGDRT